MKPTRQLLEAKWTVLKANQVMPCRLFGTIYDRRENTAVKFETKSIDFHWRTNASENIFYVLLTRVLRSQFANKDGETISQESLCIIRPHSPHVMVSYSLSFVSSKCMFLALSMLMHGLCYIPVNCRATCNTVLYQTRVIQSKPYPYVIYFSTIF